MEYLLALGTLLPIVNPVSAAFVFQQLTKHDTEEKRKNDAITASIACAITLLAFLFLGHYILAFFGITIYAFRVAGGLYLGVIAFRMLGPHLRHDPEGLKHKPGDIAIIPLAIPLLSGPGAITSTLVLAQDLSWLSVSLAILTVSVLSLIALLMSSRMQKVLGETGTNVVERLLGLLVLVIAVQFLFNGISGYLLSMQ